MAVKFLDNTGLGYFWGKIKAWCSSTFAAIAHTHTSYAVKHSYITAANAAKNWYRIANANTSQTDTTKPIHAQFILTAYNTSYDAGYYERWFVNAEVFGRNAHIIILGNTSAPFSQARILYENTIADLDANDRPAIDIYLNYQLSNRITNIEIEEVYNSGWTFVEDGQISVSTVPSGFENVACSVRNNGVDRSTYADYAPYLNRQISNFTAAFSLADSNTYRSRTLNCTGTFTITIPSINSGYMWCVIKNKNTSSGVITLHPSTTSILIDGSNADITLQPMEYVCIHSAGANNYSLIADGRWKSQKADKGTTLSDYGITDAKIANGTITLGSNSITPITSHQTLPTLSRTISGSGNAITDITVSNHAITATKGSTFLTSASTLDATKLSGTIPSSCYTNTTYTAGTGLSLSGTQFSLASHNQASNTINTMTGYSKPNFTSAISTSDTLNQAIGKLEKSIDDADISNVVHKTGDETVSGVKTFTGNMRLSDETDSQYGLVIRNLDFTRGVIPEDALWTGIYFCDANSVQWDVNGTASSHGRLSAIEGIVSPDGWTETRITTYKNESSSTALAELKVGYNYEQGIAYAKAPSTSVNRTNGADILTRDWIPKDERIVHNGGTEYIAGSKRFTYGAINVINTDAHLNTTPTTNSLYWSYNFLDKNDELSARCLHWYNANANRGLALGLSKKGSSNSQVTVIGSSLDPSTNKYTVVVGSSDCTAFHPAASGITLGRNSTANRWGQIYSSSTSISTSDERVKTSFASVPDAVLDAWDDVSWIQFQMKDSVERKGASARLHNGLVAQNVAKAFSSSGLDAARYGFFCYDRWDASESQLDEFGNVVIAGEEAGDLYSVRYEEALCMEAAYQRRKNKILENRISELEKQVSDMLQILQSLKGAN